MSTGARWKSAETKVARSLLDVVVLAFLEEGSVHGYKINVRFRKTFGHGLSASTIYPLLYTLEEKGFIEGEWAGNSKRKRRVYSITQKGRNRLTSTYYVLARLTKMIERTFIKEEDRRPARGIIAP